MLKLNKLKALLILFLCFCNSFYGQEAFEKVHYFFKNESYFVKNTNGGHLLITLYNKPELMYGTNAVGIEITNRTNDELEVTIEFWATSNIGREEKWYAGPGNNRGTVIKPNAILKGEVNHCAYYFELSDKKSPWHGDKTVNPVHAMGYTVVKIINLSELERKSEADKLATEEARNQKKDRENQAYLAKIEKDKSDKAVKDDAAKKLVDANTQNQNNQQQNKNYNESVGKSSTKNQITPKSNDKETLFNQSNNFVNQGNTYANQGNYAAAQESYKQAFLLNPENKNAEINNDKLNKYINDKKASDLYFSTQQQKNIENDKKVEDQANEYKKQKAVKDELYSKFADDVTKTVGSYLEQRARENEIEEERRANAWAEQNERDRDNAQHLIFQYSKAAFLGDEYAIQKVYEAKLILGEPNEFLEKIYLLKKSSFARIQLTENYTFQIKNINAINNTYIRRSVSCFAIGALATLGSFIVSPTSDLYLLSVGVGMAFPAIGLFTMNKSEIKPSDKEYKDKLRRVETLRPGYLDPMEYPIEENLSTEQKENLNKHSFNSLGFQSGLLANYGLLFETANYKSRFGLHATIRTNAIDEKNIQNGTNYKNRTEFDIGPSYRIINNLYANIGLGYGMYKFHLHDEYNATSELKSNGYIESSIGIMGRVGNLINLNLGLSYIDIQKFTYTPEVVFGLSFNLNHIYKTPKKTDKKTEDKKAEVKAEVKAEENTVKSSIFKLF